MEKEEYTEKGEYMDNGESTNSEEYTDNGEYANIGEATNVEESTNIGESTDSGENTGSKGRKWSFRIIGTLLIIAAVWICIAGDWKEVPVVIATEVLILGVALFILSSPKDYNALMDTGAILTFDRPYQIREFYEAFKEVNTPLGSAWIGVLSGRDSMIFGPDKLGKFVYLRLSKDEMTGYIGSSPVQEIIGAHATEPLIPYSEEEGLAMDKDSGGQTDIPLFQSWLEESMKQYMKNGEVTPFWEL